MSDMLPMTFDFESNSETTVASLTIVADSQIPSPLPSEDSGDSPFSGLVLDLMDVSDGDEDPEDIPAPPSPRLPGPQHHLGGTVIPGGNGDGPFRNERGHWVRRLADGRVVPILPSRYRLMTTGRADPPSDDSDDSSSDDSSEEDSE
ncbi:uncharacterized protein [Rutidosis leptorrhynchoides]|uniref:uncharacterized protein n=1 Tax=Rutidosis leptorrhynchoides TaxID=125765 RepID=UPI003A99EC13